MDQTQPELDPIDLKLNFVDTQLDSVNSDTIATIADQVLYEISDLLQFQLIDRLGKWHFRQKRPSFCDETQHLAKSLDQIDVWFNRIAKLLDRLRGLCIFASSHGSDTQLSIEKTFRLFAELLARALVVNQQPEQVFKKLSNFQLKVRMLLTSGHGFLQSIQGRVKIMLVHESQLHQLEPKPSAVIHPTDCELLTFAQPNASLGCHFQNLKLQNFVRPDRKDNKIVSDDKFAIHISAHFVRIDGGPIVVQQLSLPVVVTVHGTQEGKAWATILWDNAFSDIQRPTFDVTHIVSWRYLSTALNAMFAKKCGRLMKPRQVQFLGCKLFGGAPVADDSVVSWTRFCKDQLAGCSFTFWDWFYAAMKLIEDKHRSEWQNDRIEGFVSRHRAEEMMWQSVRGTFLLRFQESVLGHLHLAVVEPAQHVAMVDLADAKPYQSLGKIIAGATGCVYLYPDIPKQEAFTFAPDRSTSNPGYIPLEVIFRFPDSNSNNNVGIDDAAHSNHIGQVNGIETAADSINQTQMLTIDDTDITHTQKSTIDDTDMRALLGAIAMLNDTPNEV